MVTHCIPRPSGHGPFLVLNHARVSSPHIKRRTPSPLVWKYTIQPCLDCIPNFLNHLCLCIHSKTHKLPYSWPLSFSFYIYLPLGELNYIILPCSRYRWYLEILKVGEGTRLAASAQISRRCNPAPLPPLSQSLRPQARRRQQSCGPLYLEQKNYYASVPLGLIRNWTVTSSGI